ncbi:MAG: hypothetical protein IJH37_01350 [Clostridia bacterium]|nr:hypothetical protein [Clostridia bacterium]
MYTEPSIELKSDFYCRYGSAALRLYFERTGLPCVILDAGKEKLAFALGCGVRAYGRECGDILRIINAGSNECDVTFAPYGLGAQILYKEDIAGVSGLRETTEYTILKLLCDMRRIRRPDSGGLAELCDIYGSRGWCAHERDGEAAQLPLPLMHYNVILVRAGRSGRTRKNNGYARFAEGERDRIEYAALALRACRLEQFFEAINESEKAIERLMSPSSEAVAAVRGAMETDGVVAARICGMGVICLTEKDRTDSAIHSIATRYAASTGSRPGIFVVK